MPRGTYHVKETTEAPEGDSKSFNFTTFYFVSQLCAEVARMPIPEDTFPLACIKERKK